MSKTNKDCVFFDKRYEYLVKARNFHYQNFNVWMVFFLAAIGGLFTGYYTLEKECMSLGFEKIVILITGYIVSLFWHWSCKGYYYWITNFIMLITDAESKIPKYKKVYSCFAMAASNS
ncbi:MAG: hypothetical protein Pg6C_05880 [Treponemataceae bacterium]|nr:MAG: hypothetical protein Pg6C_05880 [Treponemataceae bacterium]